MEDSLTTDFEKLTQEIQDELSGYWLGQEYTLEKWDGTLPDGEICQHGWGNDIPKCSAKAEVALVRPGVADLDELTVAQLKDSLRREGLPDSGTKAELVARLVEDEDTEHHAPAVKNALAAFKKGDFAVAAEKLDFVVENLERTWNEPRAEDTIVTRYSYFCEEHAVWEREHRRLFQLYEDYAEELFGTIQNDLSLQNVANCLQPQEAERIMAGEITVEETVLTSALFTARRELEEILGDCKELGFDGDWDDLKGTAEILRILEEVDIPSTSLTKRSLSDDF